MISLPGARCACTCRDAYDCWVRRYPRDVDDDGEGRSVRDQGGPCDCPCHDEFRCEDPEEDWL